MNAQPSPETLYAFLDQAGQFFEQALRASPAARRYLEARGLDAERIALFRVGYAPPGNALLKALGTDEHTRRLLHLTGLAPLQPGRVTAYDRFRNRLMFPIRDLRGRIQGFGGRRLDEKDQPKYINSSDQVVFRKGQTVYGLHERRLQGLEAGQAVVVEGYTDVIGLAQAGFPGAVAPLGTAITPAHFSWLFDQGFSQITICFDGDSAGRQAAWRGLERVLPQLRDSCPIRFAFLPNGQDPDDYVRRNGVEAFKTEILGNSLSTAAFIVRYQTEAPPVALRLDSCESRAALSERVGPIYAQLPPHSACRDALVAILGKAVGLPAERIVRHFPQTPRPASNAARMPRSPIELLLRLLIRKPALAETAGSCPDLSGLDDEGAGLLQRLLARALAQPDIPSHALLAETAEFADRRMMMRLLHPENGGKTDLLETRMSEKEIAREFCDGLRLLGERAEVKRRIARSIAQIDQRAPLPAPATRKAEPADSGTATHERRA